MIEHAWKSCFGDFDKKLGLNLHGDLFAENRHRSGNYEIAVFHHTESLPFLRTLFVYAKLLGKSSGSILSGIDLVIDDSICSDDEVKRHVELYKNLYLDPLHRAGLRDYYDLSVENKILTFKSEGKAEYTLHPEDLCGSAKALFKIYGETRIICGLSKLSSLISRL